MAVVVLVQPLALLAGHRLRRRRRVVALSAAAMALGAAILPLADWWVGPFLLGAGFGVYVVVATSWAKELASHEAVGRAVGIFGFGTAVGAALGAPLGILLASTFGTTGLVVGATASAVLGLSLLALVPSGPRGRTALPAEDGRRTASGSPPNARSDAASDAGAPPRADHLRLPGEPRIGPRSFDVPFAVAGHLSAVTAYAVVLSAAGVITSTTVAGVLMALVVQSTLAVARLAGGFIVDRRSLQGTALVATGVLALGVVGLVLADAPALIVASGAVIGAGTGVIQTAALTLKMRRARTPQAVERSAAIWNITFDVGLGLGALVLGILLST